MNPTPSATSAVSTVSASIRAEVARRGLEQRDLAKALQLSDSGVSNRLAGRVDWRLSELEAVAAFLGIPVAQLFAA